MKLVFADNEDGRRVNVSLIDNGSNDQVVSFPGSLEDYCEHEGCFAKLSEAFEQGLQKSPSNGKQGGNSEYLSTQSMWGDFTNYYELVLKPSLLSYVKLTSGYDNALGMRLLSIFKVETKTYDPDVTFLKLQALSVFIQRCEGMETEFSLMSVYSALCDLISTCMQYESSMLGRDDSNFMSMLKKNQNKLESLCPDLVDFKQDKCLAIKCMNGDHYIWNLILPGKGAEFSTLNIIWPSIQREVLPLEFIRVPKTFDVIPGLRMISGSGSKGTDDREIIDKSRSLVKSYSNGEKNTLSALRYLELSCCVDLQNSCMNLYNTTRSFLAKAISSSNHGNSDVLADICQRHIDRIVYLRGCLNEPEFSSDLLTLLKSRCPDQVDSNTLDDEGLKTETKQMSV